MASQLAYQSGQRIALASMGVGLFLAVLKIGIGSAGHSSAVVADGIESAGDMLASGLILLALRLAARPPDVEHPYGHGRVETLAGLGVGVVLTVTGALLSIRALEHVSENLVPAAAFVLWPLLLSIGVKLGVFLWKRNRARKLHSSALSADAWNDAVDMLSGFAALVGVGCHLIDPQRFSQADRYGACAVGIIVFALGLRVIYDTALQLMDTMPDQETMEQIRKAAMGVPGAIAVEKCFARKTGLQYHVDLHLEVNALMSVWESHEIATQVRERIKAELPWVADVLVHVEPHAAVHG